MKKNTLIIIGAIIIVAIIAVILLVNTNNTPEVTLTVNEIYTKITEKTTLPEDMLSRSSSDLDLRYGIDTTKATEYIFMANTTSYYVDTIAIFKVENVDDRKQIETQLNAIKKQAMDSMNNYDAEQYKIASDGIVEMSGNYVYLIMTTDAAQVKEIIKNNI